MEAKATYIFVSHERFSNARISCRYLSRVALKKASVRMKRAAAEFVWKFDAEANRKMLDACFKARTL